ncbi:MAG: ABC transporter ATP-binding protein [Candidatus Sumerlaeia bacterium]|nr:ABC transporter ATP-binding protein [Candidatus Sumerlaeia bacterium]
MSTETPVIDATDLVVDYGKGKKKHRAVHGISFEVMPGETVGFIGANGAGKSTTMKTLMGFLFPTSGTVRLFGADCGTAESRRRIGYLPEVSLYYPFMKARELLELYGGLGGLSSAQLRERIPVYLEKVGLGGKDDILLKNFSKGMQQRLGIAQAIITEPELLIFDELSSGLDPVGRHDLRDVLLELKEQGRTIFFSSHELTEVETLCDRVIMIHKGRVVTSASVKDLMKPLNVFEIVYTMQDGVKAPDTVVRHGIEEDGNHQIVRIGGVEAYAQAMSDLGTAGADIHRTSSKSRSLEEYFIELVKTTDTDAKE